MSEADGPQPPTTTQVLGILNVTPDSFSDGGRWLDPDAAVEHGLSLFAEGAAIVDVGGESTRPGAEPVDPATEERRVVPVIEALAPHGRISIDTRHARVAEAAISAGASVLNDVSASLWAVAAAARIPWIAMHMLGEPASMQSDPSYGDVVAEVRSFLADRVARARDAGVSEVWIDPGIGFGKTVDHNLSLLRHLADLQDLECPIVIGTSRKSFLGRLHAVTDGRHDPVDPDDRLEGSLATAVWAAQHGVSWIRAHDVAATIEALRVVQQGVVDEQGVEVSR